MIFHVLKRADGNKIKDIKKYLEMFYQIESGEGVVSRVETAECNQRIAKLYVQRN